MEFLKTILGEELYKQVESKINEHNGNEANKDKLVKLANLAEGGYVDKNKYSSLEVERNSKNAELVEAQKLIAELQKGTKGNEDLQTKIRDYETQIKQLQADNAKEKLNNALKVALLENKATDIEYLTFQLEKQGELKLNENGEVDGLKEKLDGLKKQYPNFFEGSQTRTYQNGQLPGTDELDKGLTRSDILKKPYAERVKLFEQDPEAFKNAMNN